jgi:hypothetical protein
MSREHILIVAFALSVPLTAEANPMFSIDRASPAILGGVTPDDVLQPGPAVVTEGFSLGLTDDFFNGSYDDLDALSFGKDLVFVSQLDFSVDRVAVGLDNTAVRSQALPGAEEAAGDIFRALFGDNQLKQDEQTLGLTPGFFGDDLDALSMDGAADPFTYFSVDKNSALNQFGQGGIAADILVSDGSGIYATYATRLMMGLQAGDDIDALALLEEGQLDGTADPGMDRALFSLSSFSPTVTGGGGISPADVLFTDFQGGFGVWKNAADIGLRDDDELNALDTIPEPDTLWLVGVGMAFFVVRRLRETTWRL